MRNQIENNYMYLRKACRDNPMYKLYDAGFYIQGSRHISDAIDQKTFMGETIIIHVVNRIWWQVEQEVYFHTMHTMSYELWER